MSINKLTKSLVKDILKQENEDTKLLAFNKLDELKLTKNNVVVVYPGRFQPFHKGHHHSYSQLVSKFGKNNVYIATSDKIEAGRSPLKFKEKKVIMTTMFGVPSSQIVQVKNPYAPSEVLKKYDPDSTVLVVAVGQKDSSRLLGGKYYQSFKGEKDFDTYENQGYVIIASPLQLKIGGKLISGTIVRQLLGKELDDKVRQNMFKTLFGKYDKRIDSILRKKFERKLSFFPQKNGKTDGEKRILNDKLIDAFMNESSQGLSATDDGPTFMYPSHNTFMASAKRRAEKIGYQLVDFVLGREDFYDHPIYVDAVSFFPAGKAGALTPINRADYKGTQAYSAWKTHISKIATQAGYELLAFNKKEEDESKTNVEPSSDITKVEERYGIVKDLLPYLPNNTKHKELLLMGGAYGHLSHPFDDKDMTFGDMKQLVDLALQGKLEYVREKTDGQNIMVSWKDGKLRAARNKGHIKNAGKNSLTASGIKNMFAGRGDIEDAFFFAMKDLGKAIGKLNKKQRDKIFGQGTKFMSLEVMYPKTTNVIPYGLSMLYFHGVKEYNDNGEVIGDDRSAATKLSGMIKQINQSVQKTYTISDIPVTKLPKVKDYSKRKGYYFKKVNSLKNEFSLNDSDVVSLYHQQWWMEYVLNGANSSDFPHITNDVMVNLVKRWAFFDKSYKIPQMKKELKEHPKFLEWVLSTDKQDHTKLYKKNMEPFERLFLELGAEIMKNMTNFLSANPSKSTKIMIKDLNSLINKINSSDDVNVINKLKTQLDRLNSIGGFDAIVPSEGITFVFKKNLYKFTGTFAPINQIMGLFRYTR